MKARWAVLVCLLLPLAAVADVYEWVDKDGRTHYSDTPRPGATRIPMPTFQPVPPPPPLSPEKAPTEKSVSPDSAKVVSLVRIVSPTVEEMVHDNNGIVPVSWAVEPPGAIDGLSFQVMLDGQPIAKVQAGNTYVLRDVDRGEHTVQVTALDHTGKELATSGPVTFYLWHAFAP